MRERGQYGREVLRYGKCSAPGHGKWDRRMLEVVAVLTDWMLLSWACSGRSGSRTAASRRTRPRRRPRRCLPPE